MSAQIKSRICKARDPETNLRCNNKFTPDRPFVKWCSPLCGVHIHAEIKAKKAAKIASEQRIAHRAAKERAKTRGDWMKEAQKEFNAFIRARDAALPCISCGKTDVPWTVGGSWDCGHYLSVGSHPELRFEELNAHKQCKSCNGGAGKFSRKNFIVSQQYTERLIMKIGQKDVDWLNGPHEAAHLSIDDLKAIRAEYKLKLKQIEAR